MYDFTRFVEWPQQRFATSEDPIVIGVLGDELMLKSLRNLAAHRRVNGRPVSVMHVGGASDLNMPHVLYIGPTEHEDFLRMVPRLSNCALLSVTDAQPCGSSLAHICFVEAGNNVRFEIDMDAAARSQLRVSSQL